MIIAVVTGLTYPIHVCEKWYYLLLKREYFYHKARQRREDGAASLRSVKIAEPFLLASVTVRMSDKSIRKLS